MNRLHHYHVSFSVAASRGYRSTRSMSVLTTDVIKAAQIVLKEKPDAQIWNVSHRGEVDIIDPDVEDEICRVVHGIPS